MIAIRVFRHGDDPKTYKQTKNAITIGRSVDNDIVIEDLSVSAHHATIELRGDGTGIFVVDTGSTNKIVVGGQRVPEAELASGTRFHLGEVGIEVWTGAEHLEKTHPVDVSQIVHAPVAAGTRKPWADARVTVPALIVVTMGLSFAQFEIFEAEEARYAWAPGLILLLWELSIAFGLAVIAKLVTKEFHYLRLLQYLLAARAVELLAVLLLIVFDGNVDAVAPPVVLHTAAAGVIWYFFVTAVSRVYGPTAKPQKIRWISGTIAALAALGTASTQYAGSSKYYVGNVSYPLASVPGTEQGLASLLEKINADAKAVQKQADKRSKGR